MFSLEDYNYTLPNHLIAQTPADPPESCKLLVVNKKTGAITDHIFSDITDLIDPSTLIIFNNTKVIKARLLFTQRGKEISESPVKRNEQHEENEGFSGGLEIFYLSSLTDYTFTALVRPGKKFKVGTTVYMTDDISFTVDTITPEGRQLTCSQPIQDVLERYGQMPLPPYIAYEEKKAAPYQPVFAEKSGSVAAPTASLHFTAGLIKQLEKQGIQTAYTTLHVGLGTFKQVDTEEIKEYDIHAEVCEIDSSVFDCIAQQKCYGKTILAIGTTVTRTLESLPYVRKMMNKYYEDEPRNTHTKSSQTRQFRDTLTQDITHNQAESYISNISEISKISPNESRIQFETKLFLYPGKQFYLVDQLITNFHLPKSSLLMLVASYIGFENMKKIYHHAIKQSYRFYSFGDAMWIS